MQDGRYLTYSEYRKFGGTLSKNEFIVLEFEASKNIDKFTFGRLKNLDFQIDEVKMCILQLIKIFNTYQSSNNRDKSIQSENIDGYSVNYNNAINTSELKTFDVEEVIKEYLSDCQLEDGTFYLYRGR